MVVAKENNNYAVQVCRILLFAAHIAYRMLFHVKPAIDAILRGLMWLAGIGTRHSSIGRGRTVLVTTGRQVKTLHVVRALKETGARVIVTDYQHVSASAVSSCCDAFYTLPELHPENMHAWLRSLSNIIEMENVDTIVPVSTINEVLYMGVAKDRLSKVYPHVQWLCEGLEMTMKLDEKYSFGEMCISDGVPVPEHGVVTSRKELLDKSMVPNDSMDIVLKRRESSVNREEEILMVPKGKLDQFQVSPSPSDSWQWQRMIHGEEYSAWFVCHEGRVTFSSCYPSLPDLLHFDGLPVPDDVNDVLRSFITKHNLTGQYAFDYFREHGTGKFYVIECNPRSSSVLETVSETECWGEALFGIDVTARTKYGKTGFVFHRTCWPWTVRREAVFRLWDPLPFLVAEVLQPVYLIGRLGSLDYHHVDVNIGKIISSGASKPRCLEFFKAIVTEQQSRCQPAGPSPTNHVTAAARSPSVSETAAFDAEGRFMHHRHLRSIFRYDSAKHIQQLAAKFAQSATNTRVAVVA